MTTTWKFSSEQKVIKQLTGKILSKNEAAAAWGNIQEHKWYISERLRRDVGWRVAAVDYLENLIKAKEKSDRTSGGKYRRLLQLFTFAS